MVRVFQTLHFFPSLTAQTAPAIFLDWDLEIITSDAATWWYSGYESGCQTTTALCTAIAETIALAKGVVKVKYLRVSLFDYNADK